MLRFTELLTLAYRTRVKSLLKGTFLYIVLLWDLPLYGEKIIKGLGKNRGTVSYTHLTLPTIA